MKKYLIALAILATAAAAFFITHAGEKGHHDHGHKEHRAHEEHKKHDDHKDGHKDHDHEKEHKNHDDDHKDHDDHKGHDDHGHDKHVKHNAHEHGVATMNYAIVGDEVQIELETPAYNVVGFEHQPNTEAQEELVHEAVETLEKPLALFGLEGNCEVELAKVESPFPDHDDHKEKEHKDHHDGHKDHHDHKEHAHDDHKDHGEDTHSEFEMTYHFECSDTSKALTVDATKLFAMFPNFSEIRVQWLSANKQGSAELSAKKPSFIAK